MSAFNNKKKNNSYFLKSVSLLIIKVYSTFENVTLILTKLGICFESYQNLNILLEKQNLLIYVN